jgi:DNA-directed RNA polymerase specialized sigma24 family protein
MPLMNAASTDQINLRGIDWLSLNRRLLACALRWFKERGCSGPDSMLPGTGMSAKDLAADTIMELVKRDQGHTTSSSEDPFPFALKMMKNDFYDLVKSAEFKRTLIVETTDVDSSQEEIDSYYVSNTGFEAAEAAALVESLLRILRPDPKMKAYLETWLIKGISRRTDIADEMGVTEQEVTNIKRRLLYKLGLLKSAFSPLQKAQTKRV